MSYERLPLVEISANLWLYLVVKRNQKNTRKCHEFPTPPIWWRGCFLLESNCISQFDSSNPHFNQNCTFLLLAESIIFQHITSFLWLIFFVKFCSIFKLILDPPLNTIYKYIWYKQRSIWKNGVETITMMEYCG